ncbi:MAG TPA: hypothetical protein VF813_11430, partial [Anaerolineaceae bacterium]
MTNDWQRRYCFSVSIKSSPCIQEKQVFHFNLTKNGGHMAKKIDALEYHSMGRKGKIEVISTKPCLT